MNAPIRAVFYDAGNTLLRPIAELPEVLSRACGERGIEIPSSDFHDPLFAELRTSDSEARKDSTFWGSEIGARKMWMDLFHRVLTRCGLDGEIPAISRLVYEFFSDPASWTTFPEVLPTLRAVRNLGLVQGIVSNWNPGLENICLKTGISDYVDFIVASGSLGRAKPYPHIFQAALIRASVPAENCLHVGDQYYADIIGARTVNIRGVLVYRYGEMPNLDCPAVRDLEGVLPLLGNQKSL